MRRIETPIAEIAIPDSALAREATDFVREESTRLLFHHSRRVFLWGSLQAERLRPSLLVLVPSGRPWKVSRDARMCLVAMRACR